MLPAVPFAMRGTQPYRGNLSTSSTKIMADPQKRALVQADNRGFRAVLQGHYILTHMLADSCSH